MYLLKFTVLTTIPATLCVRLLLQLQVIARTVASLSPTDALDRSSGQTAAGELVSLKMQGLSRANWAAATCK